MDDHNSLSHPSPAVTPSEPDIREDDPGLDDTPSLSEPASPILEEMEEKAISPASSADSPPNPPDQPPTLLTLPRDVLLLILKEVTHTNDLTALALTNSTLYTLAIPHIYSRFDIVWPDTTVATSESKSVDALTYGLATLCHGSSFARRIQRALRPYDVNGIAKSDIKLSSTNYAEYTRKFSLGNGPNDWVAEYLITKESGKMLGTLVGIAIEKMLNLETFIWDMPTGVLADIFLSLASLADHEGHECKLEKVWIRWHDNNEAMGGTNPVASTATGHHAAHNAVFVLAGSVLTHIGVQLPPNASHPSPHPPIPFIDSIVEYPTFSVLPPLKSLSVLDIDELPYLDEMAMLIERSQGKLQELRVGISAKVFNKDFVQAWDGPELQQVDHNARWPGENRIGQRRLGGILGILVGRVYDIRRKKTGSKGKAQVGSATNNGVDTGANTGADTGAEPVAETEADAGVDTEVAQAQPAQNPELPEQQSEEFAQNTPPTSTQDTNGAQQPQAQQPEQGQTEQTEQTEQAEQLPPPQAQQQPQVNGVAGDDTAETGPAQNGTAGTGNEDTNEVETEQLPAPTPEMDNLSRPDSPTVSERKRLDGQLRLETLELERVPLSMQVCVKAFDWTCITSLTILDCVQNEMLWKMLKKQFQPIISSTSTLGMNASKPSTPTYRLSLKRIHTDITSAPLLSFLKETLAPNSLEVLFLQDRRRAHPPTVDVEQIFKGPIRRHRGSLRKLLIDSSEKQQRGAAATESIRWRNWVIKSEYLKILTSGKMPRLKELSVSLNYGDWHTFLQRLPNIPQLRSIHIPNIADHVTANIEPKELALQVVDIITLRPEIQLCYVGLFAKCFEILEVRPTEHLGGVHHAHLISGGPSDHHGQGTTDEDYDDDGDEDGETDDDEDEDDDGMTDDDDAATTPTDAEGAHSDSDDDSDMDSEMDAPNGKDKMKLRLREILFYDDKVEIFKARHGRL